MSILVSYAEHTISTVSFLKGVLNSIFNIKPVFKNTTLKTEKYVLKKNSDKENGEKLGLKVRDRENMQQPLK